MPDNKINIIVQTDQAGERLDSFIGNNSDISRSSAVKLLDDQRVLVNGESSNKKYKVQAGDRIEITTAPPPKLTVEAENIPLDIIYEDQYLAVINKPAGMVTHPAIANRSGTLVNALLYHFKNLPIADAPERPGIVHRLDKNTTGLLIVGKEEKAFKKLQQMMSERLISRQYLALICGHLKETEGTIETNIGRSTRDRKKMAVLKTQGRSAITTYRMTKRYRTYDLLEVSLMTGRTHQIRVHFAHLGHPVFGDPEYGGRDKWHRGIFAPERPLGKKLLGILKRQALHAQKLSLNHPVSGEKLEFSVPPPADFQSLLDLLESEGA